MALKIDRVSRGLRFQEIQSGIGDDNNAFADRLNRTAKQMGLPESWHPVRVSKVRNGTQDLSLEDAAVLEALDPQRRGWYWIAFGIKQQTATSAIRENARERTVPSAQMARGTVYLTM